MELQMFIDNQIKSASDNQRTDHQTTLNFVPLLYLV